MVKNQHQRQRPRPKRDPDDREDSLLEEFDSWLEFVKSGALAGLTSIFKKHEEYCRNQICANVKVSNFPEASKWHAKLDNTKGLVESIKNRIIKINGDIKNRKG